MRRTLPGGYFDPTANCGGPGSGVPGPCPTISASNAFPEHMIKAVKTHVHSRMEQLENAGDDFGHEYNALTMMAKGIFTQENLKLSQRANRRVVSAASGDKIVAVGDMEKRDKNTAFIHSMGSVQKGAGTEVMRELIQHAKNWKVKQISLDASLGSDPFYAKLGFKRSGPDNDNGVPMTLALNEAVFNRFCATGTKGGVDPTCGKGGGGGKKNHMSEKALRAQGSAKRVDKEIQRYAEEHNEPHFARAIGGLSFKDNEPVDIVVGEAGRIKHGIELKTMVDNNNNKITMKQEAMQRKSKWERANRATFHTVVFDDSGVFNAKGQGKHDLSKRRIFYRRGFGSFRVGTMHEVESMEELKLLLDTPNKRLPEAAKRKN